MAKNYQRHSKGGRFKRADIGDAGLRSYQVQQKNIIDSIKLQQQQDKDISRDQIVGLEGVASKQSENQRILENLENNIFQTKQKAIALRGKREVEALEGQAEEYKKNSEFWKDFSTTYSKQWADAAVETLDFKDRLWADKTQDMFIDQYPEIIDLELDVIKKEAYKELYSSLDKVIDTIAKKKGKDPKSEAVRAELRDEAKTILRTIRRTNKHLDKIKAKAFTDDIDQIEKNLRRTVLANPKLKWTKEYIVDHYSQAAKNLIFRSGIRQNSKEANELYNLFIRKGTAAARDAGLKHESIEDKLTTDTLLEAVVASECVDQSDKLKELFNQIKVGTYSDGKGKYKEGFDNPREAFFYMAGELASKYDSEKAFIEVMQSVPTTWGVYPKGHEKAGQPKPTTWGVRFEKNELDEIATLSKIWEDTNKDNIASKKRKKEMRQEEGLNKVRDLLSGKAVYPEKLPDGSPHPKAGQEIKFDITKKEYLDMLHDLQLEYADLGSGYPKVNDLISKALTFDFKNKNKFYLDSQLVNNWDKGFSEEFLEIYSLVDGDTQEQFKDLMQDMIALRQVGEYKTGGIKSYAKGQILKTFYKGLTNLNPEVNTHAFLIEAYEDTFYKRFNELKHIENVGERWDQAKQYTDEQLTYKKTETSKEGGKGLFQWKMDGNVIRWTVLEPDKDEALSKSDLVDRFKAENNTKPTPAVFNDILNMHKEGKALILSTDEQDKILQDLTEGRTTSVPANVQFLFDNQPGNKYKTVDELLEELTGIEIPKGGASYQEYTKDNSNLQASDIKKYSKNEQAVIVATMSLMGDSRAWVMGDKLRGLREKAELEGRELTEGDANDPIYDYNYFTLNYG